MKTLVLQVNIGRGTYTNNTNKFTTNHIEEILMPSIRSYCDKYGYDYKLVKDYPENWDVKWFAVKNSKEKDTTLIKYFYANQDEYDRILFLDTDVYATPYALELPPIEEYGVIKNNPTIRGVTNGGVQYFDKKTGVALHKFITNVLRKKDSKIISEQKHLDQFRKTYKEWKWLDISWNYMPAQHKTLDYKNVNFIHYAGEKGRKQFLKDLDKGLFK